MIAAPPNSSDLAFVGDALLALCGTEKDHPFLSESGFEAKQKRLNRRMNDGQAPEMLAGKDRNGLLAAEVLDVMVLAGLTARQTEVLNLRLSGLTFEEIGRVGHTTKQGAMNVFIQALKKVGRSLRTYEYAGLHEVYREEVARRGRARSSGR